MLIPAFQLRLNNTILQGLATVGKFDGSHPALACATTGGKVFVHTPHDNTTPDQIKYLNINKQISAMASGQLDPKSKRDILLVGTQTNLMAYDVESNKDIFYREVPDGINTMVFGRVGAIDEPLAVVGGNCSIQGFNSEGDEKFWTVTGDNVTSLALIDVDEDGANELLVGSEDFAVRIFQGEEVISEITEADRVTAICPLRGTRYGYANAGGTVGVYDKATRVWRAKSKHIVNVIAGYDLDSDGVPELISGFNSGRLEVRSDRTGEVIYKDNLGGAVSAIVKSDYRLDGREQVICCSYEGEIRGYLPADAELRGTVIDSKLEEDTLKELNQRKQELMYELKTYEENLKRAKSGDSGDGIIPTTTKVACELRPNLADKCVDLAVSTNNTACIKAVLIFAEGLFEGGEGFVYYPTDPSERVRVPLRPAKDIAAEMRIQVLVGSKMGTQFHVFEMIQPFPKFSMYCPTQSLPAVGCPEPSSSVSFRCTERPNRIALWLKSCFGHEIESADRMSALDVSFVGLRTGCGVRMALNGDTMKISVDDMEAAGEMVQDLAAFLTIGELESMADFPKELDSFKRVLTRVDEYNAVRLKMSAEMADSSQAVKTLVIKAEDSRILNNMASMKVMYSQLYELNRDLISEHTKRSTNHTELLAALKEVNQTIQKAARLRVGSAKTRVVTECRNAIKSNNIHSLFNVIRAGKAS